MSRQGAVEEAIVERRRLVNEAIDEDLPLVEPEELYEASRYLLQAGGKRLRPTILLLAAEALGDVEPLSTDYRTFPSTTGVDVDVLRAAVSIEIIQSFTLIHDDIMDDDDVRRGVPAVHREYGLSTAILAGDTLYSTAFEQMLETGAPAERSVEALSELARTCTRICEGQSLDISFEAVGGRLCYVKEAGEAERYREQREDEEAVDPAAEAGREGCVERNQGDDSRLNSILNRFRLWGPGGPHEGGQHLHGQEQDERRRVEHVVP